MEAIVIKQEAKPTDVAAAMMEKIVMFLKKNGAKPETLKSIISEVTPNIEKMAKTETDTTEPSPNEIETPEEEKSKEDTTEPKDQKSLQDRLMGMC